MAHLHSNNRQTKAVVVGAGFGGLAVALRLLARGYSVDLLEKHSDLGGRARTLELDGHRFDAGPTVITAPFIFSELFERFGENLEDHVTLLPVAPFYRMDFSDGTHFDYWDTTEALVAEIERLSPGEGPQYHAFFEAAEAMYQRGFVELATRPFTRISDMLEVFPDLVLLRADRSIYQFVSRFFQDERLRKAFSVPSLLVGGNPFRTSSLYALIHALERKSGVWYAQGGTGALVDALAALFQRHGGRLHTGQSVECLEMDGLEVRAALTADQRRGHRKPLLPHAGIGISDVVVQSQGAGQLGHPAVGQLAQRRRRIRGQGKLPAPAVDVEAQPDVDRHRLVGEHHQRHRHAVLVPLRVAAQGAAGHASLHPGSRHAPL